MGLRESLDSKVRKKEVQIQTGLIVRRFCVAILLFLAFTQAIAQQKGQQKTPISILAKAILTPAVLTLYKDTLSFEVLLRLPGSTARLPRQSSLRLRLLGTRDSLDLGQLEEVEQGGYVAYKTKRTVTYRPWMKGARLQLDLFSKKTALPLESRVLARGVRAPQLLARVGQFLPGEKIPEVGWYTLPESLPTSRSETAVFYFRYAPGKSDWSVGLGNDLEKKRLGDFLKKHPEVQKLQLTGLQSPEASEGRSSQLGHLRAEVAGKKLLEFFPELKSLAFIYGSRWNNWFDFRVALAQNEGISEDTKEAFNQILLTEASYLEKGASLRSLPDFAKVAAALYPQLRSVKVEVTARPFLGLTGQQAEDLREALGPEGKNKLSLGDWERAAALSQDLEEKGFLYSKMIQWYPNASAYTNLAVVRMRQAQEQSDLGSKEVLWEEAERVLEQARKLQVLPLTVANQGQLMVLQGEYWEGYTLLSEASVLAKSDPSLAAAIDLLRAALDVRRGDYKLSLLRFQAPITEAKDFFNKGIALYLLGEFSGASAAFEASVLQSREFGYGYYGLALLAADLGQQESALLYLQKAVTYNPALLSRVKIDPSFDSLRDQLPIE